MGRTRNSDGSKKRKKSTGRPSAYRKEFNQIAYAASKNGSTLQDLAIGFSVTPETIQNWIDRHPSFFRSIKAGQDVWNTLKVERSLLKRALGYDYTETRTKEVVLKRGRGENAVELPAIERTVTTKHVQPSDTAAMFWLQNRDKKRWKPVHAILLELQKEMGLDNLSASDTDRPDLEKLVKAIGRDGLKALRGAFKEAVAESRSGGDDADTGRDSDGSRIRLVA